MCLLEHWAAMISFPKGVSTTTYHHHTVQDAWLHVQYLLQWLEETTTNGSCSELCGSGLFTVCALIFARLNFCGSQVSASFRGSQIFTSFAFASFSQRLPLMLKNLLRTDTSRLLGTKNERMGILRLSIYTRMWRSNRPSNCTNVDLQTFS